MEMPRMRGVDAVAVLFEREACHIERMRRPGEITRGQRDLGFRHDASCAGHGLFRTEGARCATQQDLCPIEIAELRHGDAAQRQRRWIVAQGYPVECAQRIAAGQRMRCRRDQRVHRNPVTLVTLTARASAPNLSHDLEPVLGTSAPARPA
jgi:hypothetical protein